MSTLHLSTEKYSEPILFMKSGNIHPSQIPFPYIWNEVIVKELQKKLSKKYNKRMKKKFPNYYHNFGNHLTKWKLKIKDKAL